MCLSRAIVGVLLLLLFVGCFAGESADVSTKAVADFRIRYYEKAFDQMYRDADPELRKATTAKDWAKVMRVVSSRLGQVRSMSDPAWQINATTSGKFVTLRYETEFEKGKATEIFVWHVKDGRALLVGYNINSLSLLSE